MAASSLLDVCRYTPTAGGTTDWTYSSAVTGYQSPSAAGVVNGAQYSYRAESADLSQWEVGTGTYNTSTGVLSRTTVLFNSSGTTSKINFSVAPQVAIIALAEDVQTKLVAGQLPGTATNNSASSGNVGELISSSATTGSLTSGVSANVTSITLTAGDWDVSAVAQFSTSGATSTTDWYMSISTTSASLTAATNTLALHERVGATSDHSFDIAHPPAQALLAGSTTYYLVVQWVGSGTAPTASGIIRARRMR